MCGGVQHYLRLSTVRFMYEYQAKHGPRHGMDGSQSANAGQAGTVSLGS